MPEDTSETLFLDPSLMVIVPVMDFIGKLLLQLCKTHHIQSLENVGTMCRISNEFDVKLPSFLKELKGEV